MSLKDTCSDGDQVIFKLLGAQHIGTLEYWNGAATILMIRYDDGPDSDDWDCASLVELDDIGVEIICNLGNYYHVITGRAIKQLLEI